MKKLKKGFESIFYEKCLFNFKIKSKNFPRLLIKNFIF